MDMSKVKISDIFNYSSSRHSEFNFIFVVWFCQQAAAAVLICDISWKLTDNWEKIFRGFHINIGKLDVMLCLDPCWILSFLYARDITLTNRPVMCSLLTAPFIQNAMSHHMSWKSWCLNINCQSTQRGDKKWGSCPSNGLIQWKIISTSLSIIKLCINH